MGILSNAHRVLFYTRVVRGVFYGNSELYTEWRVTVVCCCCRLCASVGAVLIPASSVIGVVVVGVASHDCSDLNTNIPDMID